MTREQVIGTIEDFLANRGEPYDWDDFLSLKLRDPDLEEIRQKCANTEWNTVEGRIEVERILAHLRIGK